MMNMTPASTFFVDPSALIPYHHSHSYFHHPKRSSIDFFLLPHSHSSSNPGFRSHTNRLELELVELDLNCVTQFFFLLIEFLWRDKRMMNVNKKWKDFEWFLPFHQIHLNKWIRNSCARMETKSFQIHETSNKKHTHTIQDSKEDRRKSCWSLATTKNASKKKERIFGMSRESSLINLNANAIAKCWNTYRETWNSLR